MKMIKLLLAIILLLTVVGFLDALNMNKSKFNLRLERESEPIKCLPDKKCANADLVCYHDNCIAKNFRESDSAKGSFIGAITSAAASAAEKLVGNENPTSIIGLPNVAF